MTHHEVPEHYKSLQQRFADVIEGVEALGATIRNRGPINKRTAHLIQMAAAAAIGSEGSVQSHARRALEAGASTEELCHAILLLVSTIGFPRAAAGIKWVDAVIAAAAE